MKFERLADTQEIRKIESRFNNLISRTFLKGAVGVPASEIFNSVQKAFSSKTYEIQLDKIIDDTVIASVDYADKKTEEMGGSSPGSAQASKPAGLQISRAAAITPAAITPAAITPAAITPAAITPAAITPAAITPAAITPAVTQPAGEKTQLTAGKDKPLPITEEAIKQTKALSGDAAESVTRWLKDNDLYSQHPDQLARQVKDLWDGELYKARRFAVTFTADLAENTAIHRYSDLGITYLQFFAEIDDKTTRQCRAFHGTLIKSDSLDAQRYRPPLHHHCRSCLIPATSKTLKNEDLLIENRDFTQQLNQDFKPLPGRVDSDEITEVFKDINKFNDKYRIDQFILDEDLQLRLMKLNLNVYTEIPGKGKTTLDDFVKPEKVEPPKVEPEKVESIIQEHEDKIKARKSEKAFVFDKDGNIILSKSGGKHSIGFTDDEAAKFEDAIFIHNHPGGAPFSATDIETACINKLNEMRAVGEKGTYIMKMKSGENFNPEIWPKIKEEFSINYEVELRKLTARVRKGELKNLTNNELNQIFQDEAWKQTVQNIPELDYSYIKK